MSDRLTNRRMHPQIGRKAIYYLPVSKLGEFVFQTFGGRSEIKGDVITRLGEYEDLGSVEYIKKKLGIG